MTVLSMANKTVQPPQEILCVCLRESEGIRRRSSQDHCGTRVRSSWGKRVLRSGRRRQHPENLQAQHLNIGQVQRSTNNVVHFKFRRKPLIRLQLSFLISAAEVRVQEPP